MDSVFASREGTLVFFGRWEAGVVVILAASVEVVLVWGDLWGGRFCGGCSRWCGLRGCCEVSRDRDRRLCLHFT